MKPPSDTIAVGQLQIRYLQDGSQDGRLGVFEVTVPPGALVPPPHSHLRNEEFVYILEGRLRVTVNETTRDLGPGDSMATPKGAVHGFTNPFATPARAIFINSPDIGANYFREVSAAFGSDGAPDVQRLVRIMAEYDVVTPPARPK